MKVIGLTGKAGAGKNYISDLIERAFFSKETFASAAFAGPLKEMCAEMFGLSRQDVYSTEGKKKTTLWQWEWLHESIAKRRTGPMTIREILQTVGTELVRDRWCTDHWARYMDLTIQQHLNGTCQCFVITDLRFPNEMKILSKYDSRIIRVEGRATEGVPMHASESYDIQTPYVINNSPGTNDTQLVNQLVEIFGGW